MGRQDNGSGGFLKAMTGYHLHSILQRSSNGMSLNILKEPNLRKANFVRIEREELGSSVHL